MLFKKYEIVMDVGLDDLSYVKIAGIFRKNLFVGVRNGPWVDSVHLRVNDVDGWASHVSSLIRNP